MVVEDVLLLCSCRARSQRCYHLGRSADRHRLTGGQLRPTDRAMAARSARTSSSEEDARSTDEEDRLLTERCIERQLEKHFAGKTLV